MDINILRVFNGDAIHLSYKDAKGKIWNILIDGGPSPAYSKKSKRGKTEYGALHELITDLKKADLNIDLLILTHIDADHIEGLLQWFRSDTLACQSIERVWFNSGKMIAEYLAQPENPNLQLSIPISAPFETSVNQAVDFEKHIEKIHEQRIILAGASIVFGELEFQFLSPNRQKLEDLLKLYKKKAKGGYFETAGGRGNYSKSLKEHIKQDVFVTDARVANGSSIAFILTHNDTKYLFLGDSHPSLIVEELMKLGFSKTDPLRVAFVKISHHGSEFNTSPDLLELIKTDKYLISTHGLQHGHPDKTLIARIAHQNPKAYIGFNYPELINFIFSEEDMKDFPDLKPLAANSILNAHD